MRVTFIYFLALLSFLAMLGASGVFFRVLANSNQPGDEPAIMVAQKRGERLNGGVEETDFRGQSSGEMGLGDAQKNGPNP